MTYTYFVTYIFFKSDGDPYPGYANVEYKNSQPIVSMADIMEMQNEILKHNHGIAINAVRRPFRVCVLPRNPGVHFAHKVEVYIQPAWAAEDKIYVSRLALDAGAKKVAAIILLSILKIENELYTESAEMQDFLLDLVIKLAMRK